jgi:hypothetical protein
VSVIAGTFGITTVGAPAEISDPFAVIIALRTIRTARILASGATADAYHSEATHGTDEHYAAEKTRMETPYVGKLVSVWIDLQAFFFQWSDLLIYSILR